MNVIVELILSTIFAAAGQVIWKIGMNGLGKIESFDIPTMIKLFTNVYVDIGLALYGISTIFWLAALSKKDLSFAYPFIAGTYVFVLILSYFIVGETFNIYRMIGASVVIAGLFIIVKFGW